MKKLFIGLLRLAIYASLAIFVLISFMGDQIAESGLNPFDYARITDVDYKAVVVDEPDSRGKIIVTERLTFDIHAASRNNPFWELWRDLPESFIDGVKVDYTVNSVKQIFENGSSVTYEQSPRLYWEDYDYINTAGGFGPQNWFHSPGPYNEDLRQYECVLFYVDGIYREKVIFEIEYEMYNAALRYNDSSELYITPYSERTINYLNSFRGQILFPTENMPKAGNYDAHTYGTNANSFPFTESSSVNPGYHTFSFELDQSQLKFRPYNEYLEFALIAYGDDKHIFTEYASINQYTNDDVLAEFREEQVKYDTLPAKFKNIKLITLSGLTALALFALVLAYKLNKRIQKSFCFYDPEVQIDYFRDIPSDLDPNFAAALIFCKHKPPKKKLDGYSAIMLSLVRKGYIELTQITPQQGWDSNNIKFVINHHPIVITSETIQSQNATLLEPLTKTETYYFDLIVRHSNGHEITMEAFQRRVATDYEYTNSFITFVKAAINVIGASDGYFQKRDYEQPRRKLRSQARLLGFFGFLIITVGNFVSFFTRLDLAFGGFFILGISLIVGAIYLLRKASKYVLLTEFGENEYAKWRGLYNFLNSDTLLNEREVIEVHIWEKYLIYATAFGIADKVIQAIRLRCPDVTTSPVLRNPYYRSHFFYRSGHSFRTSTRSASFTARSGGHGGYGGGGRGGGGGGGGH